jgi:hypothetical protein
MRKRVNPLLRSKAFATGPGARGLAAGFVVSQKQGYLRPLSRHPSVARKPKVKRAKALVDNDSSPSDESNADVSEDSEYEPTSEEGDDVPVSKAGRQQGGNEKAQSKVSQQLAHIFQVLTENSAFLKVSETGYSLAHAGSRPQDFIWRL